MSEFANRHGTGAFRRRFIFREIDPGTIAAGIEDEFHHFELRLHHDGTRVTDVRGDARRYPWVTCADSPSALVAFIGAPLTTRLLATIRWTSVFEQCTHQFDLCTLAIAHAARVVAGGQKTRTYDAVVPDWTKPPYDAYLSRDGAQVMEWTIGDGRILGPDPFTDVPLRGRFTDWCENNLDDDGVEAALVLRIAARLSWARTLDMEEFASADLAGLPPGNCFTVQPQRVGPPLRNRGSLRDYGHSPEALLKDFDARAAVESAP